MHLSISNFNPKNVSDTRARILLVGMLAGILLVLGLENLLRYKGLEKNVRDNAGLWASQRAKASRLGKHDYILVGNSRIQLGMDIAVMKQLTHHKVAQLAIDGEPFLPVLNDLANDETVNSTVIVGGGIVDFVPRDSAMVNEWVRNYHHNFEGLWLPEKEEFLSAQVQSFSVLYSSIFPPLELIKLLTTIDHFPKTYLKTLPNRSRNADYKLVPMPDFYIGRVMRTLGRSVEDSKITDYASFEKAVIKATEKGLSPFDTDRQRFEQMRQALEKLHARGVKVYLVNFPVSGLVEEIENRRYPKSAWETVVKDLPVTAIDYRDYPGLQFNLAEGSHLDYQQKQVFTLNLLNIINSRQEQTK